MPGVFPRVTGGLVASPTAVVLGDIPLEQPTRMTVRLRNNGALNRRVQSVGGLQPDRFDVRLVSPDASDSGHPAPELPVAGTGMVRVGDGSFTLTIPVTTVGAKP
ncbi:hypothetical protein C1280_24815 [Gemmata obscuriglobus]|uniref:Uncharacterized protein n=1 Tax=Gemmata obscuriglobus TaxID=114 RepID=A0A2Z3H2D3_9BACT|nr:hypothetical protein C1280_24815 [Gemmata obscuriglobus]